MKKIKILGFSLVELMVSLVVVSCIEAAMTPIITKKLSSSGVTLGVDSGISSTCTDICPDCELCNDENAYNVKIYVKKVNIKMKKDKPHASFAKKEHTQIQQEVKHA